MSANNYKQLQLQSIEEIAVQQEENQLNLREFVSEFINTSEELGVYVTVNPNNFELHSVHATTMHGLKTLVKALDKVYVELINCTVPYDDVFPFLSLIEDYIDGISESLDPSKRHGLN